jgi:hypothetical protein
MNNPKIAIIGLGYVGLPLAVEFLLVWLRRPSPGSGIFTRSQAPAWECININSL